MPQGSNESSNEDLSTPSSPGGSKVDSSDKESFKSESELVKVKGVHVDQGRVDVRRILAEEISCASGPVSVDGGWASLYRCALG
jgi:hypothetical protein